MMGSVGNLRDDEQMRYNSRPTKHKFGYKADKHFITPSNGGNSDVEWWNHTTHHHKTNNRAGNEPEKPKKGQKKKSKSKSHRKSDFSYSYSISRSHTSSSMEMPLINFDIPSPPIWTIGSALIMVLCIACEIVYDGVKFDFYENPMLGPAPSTLLQMGAKYGPLIADGEFWRFFTAIFLQPGIILVVVAIILTLFTKSVERDSGFWRAVLLYILTGSFGYIFSCIFIPTEISCGSTGALFGYLGVIVSDLISTWRMIKRPGLRLTGMIILIIILLVCGLTPYVDNWVHIGGFIMGLLASLVILPNLSFGKCERICHAICAFIAFPMLATVYMVCLVVFYRSVNVDFSWCKFCHYINCVNISGWCKENLPY